MPALFENGFFVREPAWSSRRRAMKLYDEKTHEEVALPVCLDDFRGEPWYVLDIEQDASPGSSGKVRASRPGEFPTRTFFPGVFRCYIADEPRAE